MHRFHSENQRDFFNSGTVAQKLGIEQLLTRATSKTEPCNLQDRSTSKANILSGRAGALIVLITAGTQDRGAAIEMVQAQSDRAQLFKD